MKKPDDCTLTPEQYTKIKGAAEKVLKDADAFGRFPTPISDILSVAKVHEVEEDVLNESLITKFRKEVGKALRGALSKVLGLFDARTRFIFIDRSLHAVKQTFIKLHETAHGYLSWQTKMYAVVEDGEQNLDPDVADLFDREANVFASEVLFQNDSFISEANDLRFDIFTPVKLASKYGASLYSSIRQYVSKNTKACTVLVLNPPEPSQHIGFKAHLRRCVSSPSFIEQFGQLTLPSFFTPNDSVGAIIPVGKRKASGKRRIILSDLNGVEHQCIAEAFTQTYQVFILIHSVRTLTSTSVLISTD